MANMSYCRWHNTNLDVRDCFEAFHEMEEMSEEEIKCAKRMINNMCKFLQDNGVIDDYDWEGLFHEFDMLLKD